MLDRGRRRVAVVLVRHEGKYIGRIRARRPSFRSSVRVRVRGIADGKKRASWRTREAVQCGVKVAVADADTPSESFLLLLVLSSSPPSLSSVLDDDASDAIPPWMFKERGRKEGKVTPSPAYGPMPTPLHSADCVAG